MSSQRRVERVVHLGVGAIAQVARAEPPVEAGDGQRVLRVVQLVAHEVAGAQEDHIQSGDGLELLFQSVQAEDRPRPVRFVRAETAERYGIPYAVFLERPSQRVIHALLITAHVRR